MCFTSLFPNELCPKAAQIMRTDLANPLVPHVNISFTVTGKGSSLRTERRYIINLSHSKQEGPSFKSLDMDGLEKGGKKVQGT